MTRKLRYLLLSMMILYSSLPSSITCLSASSEWVLVRMALRQVGSPSWEITIFSSLLVMASYNTPGSSYSSGEVKWSWARGVKGELVQLIWGNNPAAKVRQVYSESRAFRGLLLCQGETHLTKEQCSQSSCLRDLYNPQQYRRRPVGPSRLSRPQSHPRSYSL